MKPRDRTLIDKAASGELEGDDLRALERLLERSSEARRAYEQIVAVEQTLADGPGFTPLQQARTRFRLERALERSAAEPRRRFAASAWLMLAAACAAGFVGIVIWVGGEGDTWTPRGTDGVTAVAPVLATFCLRQVAGREAAVPSAECSTSDHLQVAITTGQPGYVSVWMVSGEREVQLADRWPCQPAVTPSEVGEPIALEGLVPGPWTIHARFQPEAGEPVSMVLPFQVAP